MSLAKKKRLTLKTATSYLSYTSPFVTSGLMIICVMLAMAGASLQIYQLEQESTVKRLKTQAKFMESAQKGKLITNLFGETLVFSEPANLPKKLEDRLHSGEAVLLSKKAIKALGWNGFEGRTFVMAIPGTNPSMLMAAEVPQKRTQTFIYIGIYLSLAILLIMLAYALLSHLRILRRLRYINDAADAIVSGKLEKRIPINPNINDEYSHLSQVLNNVLDKNASLMQDLRQVNSNIAHDLKSPLNRIRSRMDVALLSNRAAEEYEQVLSKSIVDIDSLLSTFQALLLMGNLDSSARNFQLKKTSLSEALENLAELYDVVAEESGHSFSADIAPSVDIHANINLFSQAISNLLDNAIKYTPRGGDIKLTLKCQSGLALIVLTDNGPGIPLNQQEKVFERFVRLDSARQLSGTGLGLSLVRSILQVHSASIQLHDNHSGVRVEIRLRYSEV